MDPVTVYIVDDDEDSRFMVRYHLQSLRPDFRLQEFTDSDQALKFFRNPDQVQKNGLAFLDIDMEGMNGFAFLDAFKELQEKHGTPPLKFVMYTASEKEDDVLKSQCYEEVLEYIIKPVSRRMLEDLISQYLVKK